MSLIKWRKLQSELGNDVFDWGHPFFGLSFFPLIKEGDAGNGNVSPALDVIKNNEKVIVKADIPGLKKEDIQIFLDRNVLTVSGERKQEKSLEEEVYRRIERFCGAFERRIVLDSDVDAAGVEAKYKEGVLEIVLPKSKESKERRVEIKE